MNFGSWVVDQKYFNKAIFRLISPEVKEQIEICFDFWKAERINI